MLLVTLFEFFRSPERLVLMVTTCSIVIEGVGLLGWCCAKAFQLGPTDAEILPIAIPSRVIRRPLQAPDPRPAPERMLWCQNSVFHPMLDLIRPQRVNRPLQVVHSLSRLSLRHLELLRRVRGLDIRVIADEDLRALQVFVLLRRGVRPRPVDGRPSEIVHDLS